MSKCTSDYVYVSTQNVMSVKLSPSSISLEFLIKLYLVKSNLAALIRVNLLPSQQFIFVSVCFVMTLINGKANFQEWSIMSD